MGKQTVRADIEKNRLYLTQDGFFTDEEVERNLAINNLEAEKLKPGFVLIIDAVNLKPHTPTAAQKVQEALGYLLKLGLKKIIAIVPSSSAASMQIRRISKTDDVESMTVNVYSLAEAEKIADTLT